MVGEGAGAVMVPPWMVQVRVQPLWSGVEALKPVWPGVTAAGAVITGVSGAATTVTGKLACAPLEGVVTLTVSSSVPGRVPGSPALNVMLGPV